MADENFQLYSQSLSKMTNENSFIKSSLLTERADWGLKQIKILKDEDCMKCDLIKLRK
jgi:hypothetical protein